MAKLFLSGRMVWVWLLVLMLTGAGCATTGTNTGPATGAGKPEANPDILRIGDLVGVTFQGAPDLTNHEERIKEDGTITLKHIGSIKAAGMTVGGLQRDIHTAYVPKYYPNLVVTVRAEDRFFFVDGEVKVPNRYVYSGQQTVLRAIATAQGFTDFAAKDRVELTRVDGQKFVVDCKKAQRKPELDLPVYPGDRVMVPRRVL
jgi:polysaccharide export outer membrane protein